MPMPPSRRRPGSDHLRIRAQQDLCVGLPGARNVDLEIRRGEIFALLGPERRRQDHADQHHLRHRQPDARARSLADGHDIVRDYRAARAEDRPGAAGADHRRLRDASGPRCSFSRGLFGKPPNPAHLEKVLRDLSLWDKKDSKIMTLSGGMKRRVMIAKALSPRAADPVPRRAHRRRRRRAAPRHVGDGPRACARAASPSS